MPLKVLHKIFGTHNDRKPVPISNDDLIAAAKLAAEAYTQREDKLPAVDGDTVMKFDHKSQMPLQMAIRVECVAPDRHGKHKRFHRRPVGEHHFGMVRASKHHLEIAFRGSSEPRDWLYNMDCGTITPGDIKDDESMPHAAELRDALIAAAEKRARARAKDFKMHRGFLINVLEAVRGLWPAVCNWLDATKDVHHRIITISGHSLGGAMAAIFSTAIGGLDATRDITLRCITMGAPRPFKGSIASEIHAACVNTSVRFVNVVADNATVTDFVTNIAPGFRHSGQARWLATPLTDAIRDSVATSSAPLVFGVTQAGVLHLHNVNLYVDTISKLPDSEITPLDNEGAATTTDKSLIDSDGAADAEGRQRSSASSAPTVQALTTVSGIAALYRLATYGLGALANTARQDVIREQHEQFASLLRAATSHNGDAEGEEALRRTEALVEQMRCGGEEGSLETWASKFLDAFEGGSRSPRDLLALIESDFGSVKRVFKLQTGMRTATAVATQAAAVLCFFKELRSQRKAYKGAEKEFKEQLARLKHITDDVVPPLVKRLEQIGDETMEDAGDMDERIDSLSRSIEATLDEALRDLEDIEEKLDAIAKHAGMKIPSLANLKRAAAATAVAGAASAGMSTVKQVTSAKFNVVAGRFWQGAAIASAVLVGAQLAETGFTHWLQTRWSKVREAAALSKYEAQSAMYNLRRSRSDDRKTSPKPTETTAVATTRGASKSDADVPNPHKTADTRVVDVEGSPKKVAQSG